MRRAFIVTMLAIGIAAPLSAEGARETRSFTTRDGVEVMMPPVPDMSCDDIAAKLDEIDATGYRHGAPQSSDMASMLLINYENLLSMNFFRRCLKARTEAAAPHAAFGDGFTQSEQQ
jgi:hypothetical protein